MKFDTYFFDDSVKVQVYHRNSPNKVNCIGKGTVELREVQFDSRYTLLSVPLFNKKLQRVVGYLYFTLTYQGRSPKLFDLSQLEYMQQPSQFDKYEFFDGILRNDFTTDCHYGYIEIKLHALNIPHMPCKDRALSVGGEEERRQIEELYLIKLKEGPHHNQVVVQSPDVILDRAHMSFFTQTQSPNERVHLEFYQILSEEAFEPSAPDFSSKRLIQQLTLPLKYIPFARDEEYSVASNHSFLVNMPENSGLVAELGFDFRYVI
jgi:hypothetical protein